MTHASPPDGCEETPTPTLLGSIVYDAMCDCQLTSADPSKTMAVAEYIAASILDSLEAAPR